MRLSLSSARRILFAFAMAALLPQATHAQDPTPGGWNASRAELERLAQTLEQSANASAYGARSRAQARAQLLAVRRRLAEGDFFVGERIHVSIDGQQLTLRDTLTVSDSLVLAIPNVRRVRLAGVLRSELGDRLTREVSEVVRGATVSARTLLRLAVFGEVASPGFLSVPPEMTIDQLVTRAGGPTAGADFAKATVRRGELTLLTGAQVQSAIARGQNVAQLDLRSGDALVLPLRRPGWDRATALQAAGILIGPLVTVLLVR